MAKVESYWYMLDQELVNKMSNMSQFTWLVQFSSVGTKQNILRDLNKLLAEQMTSLALL